MCGIVGYIGDKTAKEVIIKGLKRLEYRGYDSAGISTITSDGINTTKTKGKVSKLESAIQKDDHQGGVGIGHTRWATHGAPSDKNAHPHSDASGKFTLVHNGIIENYTVLKQLLADNQIHCETDTDTEVLVQFIGYLYEREKLSFADTVRLALTEVVGAYGIVVLCADEPDTIIAARLGSPLLLGIGENEYFVASDSSPIIEYTRNIVFLDEGEMAIIQPDLYKVINIKENLIVPKDVEEIKYNLEEIEKGGYDHFMLKEINEQAVTIAEAIRGRVNAENNQVMLGGIYDWVQQILDANHIIITACGTSWHASLIGSYILEELLQVPVKVEYASEFRYRETAVNGDTVVICVSQSGETADTLAAIKKAKEKGALTLGIVNAVGSSIARETHCGVYIHAGPEIGVASTKAFTAQVTIFNLIGLLLSEKKGVDAAVLNPIITDLIRLPDLITRVLHDGNSIIPLTEDFMNVGNFLYLGRGYQFPVALEGALKLKEISYIHAEGYPAAEMKHGPIALIDEDMPVVFIVTEKGYDKIVSNIQEVKARGGKIIIITSETNKELENFSDHIIQVPKVNHCLQPILTTIPLQLLAYHMAVLKGCDVDMPRNLAKSVTVE
ncbi:MAG: glutamine--fructose-6-phosphate transaminase (isomerizing) [Candidatus Marinimicrobia bacterium]|nr:glutamine--fructose-6-phosphate transaminase (isomerizing) [Candidatus Neomarinimicrobiota bacterium]